MYKIIWDSNANGILLTNRENKTDTIVPPRPVFFEELDLLGLDKIWKYPKSQEPLLWAIGRRYFYKGNLVAKANGGNLFKSPKIEFTEKGQNIELKPINVDTLIKNNKRALFIIENEALDFIEKTYSIYKKKKYVFGIAYSGGKDSQVVLDLVTRIVPPNELVVIFSDTTMEIAYTYENVEKTKEEYENKYPGLKFYTAKPPKPAIEFWKDFGPPSRIHRWCCTVTKTVPFHRLIRDTLTNTGKKYKNTSIVVFEGVRQEESEKRSHYERRAENAKHFMTTNSRPILYWNTSEVFLYMFFRKLIVNKGYRVGLNRVGCSICPFSSGWTEFILHKTGQNIYSYIRILEKLANSQGLQGENEIKMYISRGEWKKRAGGKGVSRNSDVRFVTNKNSVKAVIQNPQENFLEWAKVVGDIMYRQTDKDKTTGEIKVKDIIIPFNIKKKGNRETVEIYNTSSNIDIIGKVKKIAYKSTFCVHCGACEIECPTGALKVTPTVRIDSNACSHCGNCINFTEKGCLVAKSIYENIGGTSMRKKTGGIDKYSTFGLREIWLNAFLNFGEQWLEENNLGPKQIPAVIHWLADAELIDPKTKKITATGEYLRKIYLVDKLFVWSIIWSNMYYNSKVISWYCNTIKWGNIFSKKDLKTRIKENYPNLSDGTLRNPIDAMINMFDNSPLGTDLQIGVLDKKGRTVKFIKKIGTDAIHSLATAYSLYKAAEYIGRKDFTVSEIYNEEFKGGPYKLFGIPRDKLERILRGLQEDKEQILRVDLVADLDNIYLRNDLLSLDILKIAEERLK